MSRGARLAVLAAAFLPVSCMIRYVDHEVRITLRDPTGRLGPPPWKVGITSAISAFDNSAEWVLRLSGGEARPDAPYVGHFSTESVLMPWGIPRPAELEMALVVPALVGQDWLNTVIVMGKDGTARGYARRTSFGSHSKGTAEILMMRGTARHRQSGWSLDLTIDIPPAR